MSNGTVQILALVIGLLVFGAIVGLLFVRRRAAERAAGGPLHGGIDDMGKNLDFTRPVVAQPTSEASSGRRRPASPPPTGSPIELASAIRSLILRAVADRAPAGWSALVLCPPPHPELMTWHVHLAPKVALDLQDGRSVTVAAPLASHEWHLAGGRVVGIGDGDQSEQQPERQQPEPPAPADRRFPGGLATGAGT